MNEIMLSSHHDYATMNTSKRALDDFEEAGPLSSDDRIEVESQASITSTKRIALLHDNSIISNNLRLPWSSLFASILDSGVQVEQLKSAVFSSDPADDGSSTVGSSSVALNVGRHIELWIDRQTGNVDVPIEPPSGSSGDGGSCYFRNRLYRCFGMAHGIKIRLIGEMEHLQSKLKVTKQGSNVICTKIDFVDEFAFLVDQEGIRFGQINDNTAKHFSQLSKLVSVDFKVLADMQAIHRCVTKVWRQYDAVVQVDINVYGELGARDQVSQSLSEGKIYLQHPLWNEDGIEYDNPHMLTFDDINLQEYTTSTAPTGSAHGNSTSIEDAIIKVKMAETSGWSLEGMKCDARVVSELLPHQEQALQFMVQREEQSVPSTFHLWRPSHEDEGSGYQHAISGCWTKEDPIELQGGILADDMGMGKTLSALSLITRRSSAAREWATAKVHCDTTASTAAVRLRATLVVVSSVLIMNGWFEEIETHLGNSLRVVRYHGKSRRKLMSKLNDADLVLTTYHTLAAERKADKSSLRSIAWFRIVLDEAHMIRRQSTTLFKAVSELDALHRWCLSGTPIQNTLTDLGSLLGFLRLHPLDKASMFRKHVTALLSENLEEATARLQTLLNSICLRRRIGRLHLLPTEDSIRYLTLTDSERAHYDKMRDSMIHAMSYGLREFYSNTPFGKFHIQLQSRLLCNHGTFQKEFRLGHGDAQTQKEDALVSMGVDAELKCSYCEQYMPILQTSCTTNQQTYLHGRVVCDECRIRTTEMQSESLGESNEKKLTAHSKGQALRRSATPTHPADDRSWDDNGYASKMVTLVEDVVAELWSTKSIIFSCWTRSLDLVAKHLERAEVKFERIDGSKEVNERQGILNSFAQDDTRRVLLMTTGTGAYGLNLAVANRVFILEPQWNPSIESQAIARVQRYKQTQCVRVVRYVVRGTVEEDIRRQQTGKAVLAERGFTS